MEIDRPQFYTTIKDEASSQFDEKKSIFIGYAKHVTCAEEAAEFIKKIKAKHYDAKHNVSAFILSDGLTARYSDDGEPQGSAGIPVLECIKKAGVSDACVVVTRYFGGILLGVGGLVRAYTKAAKQAIEAAGIVTFEAYEQITVECSYSDYQRVGFELSGAGAIVDNTEYADGVKISFAVKKNVSDDICQRINEISAGKAVITHNGERYDCG